MKTKTPLYCRGKKLFNPKTFFKNVQKGKIVSRDFIQSSEETVFFC